MSTTQGDENMHIYDSVIIGGGPAGYSAALYAARAGLDTLLLERLSPGGQMALTGDIDNYPGFDEGIDGFTLGMKMMQGAQRFGGVTEYAEVKKLILGDEIKQIITDDKTYYARTVILAMGANPRKLGLENEDELTGKGIHYCAHCDGRFYKDKTVTVVGGGNSAAADALYLSRLVKKVYLVHRRDSLRAEKIYHQPLTEADNVEFLWDSKIVDLNADEGFKGVTVENVKTGRQSAVFCDGLFVSIGRSPATEIDLGGIVLDEKGYIIADETTRTNIEGVFAAGDIRTKALRQVVTAAADGAVAVHFAEEYLSVKK